MLYHSTQTSHVSLSLSTLLYLCKIAIDASLKLSTLPTTALLITSRYVPPTFLFYFFIFLFLSNFKIFVFLATNFVLSQRKLMKYLIFFFFVYVCFLYLGFSHLRNVIFGWFRNLNIFVLYWIGPNIFSGTTYWLIFLLVKMWKICVFYVHIRAASLKELKVNFLYYNDIFICRDVGGFSSFLVNC